MVKKAVKDALGHYVQNAEVLLSLLQEDAELLKSSEKGLEDDQGKEVKGEGLTGCCYRGGAFLYLS